jgi:UDP-N-acetylmuramate dehydrogenase
MYIKSNEPLKNYSYIKIGGQAKEIIFIENYEDLKELENSEKEYFVLGNASNILFSDDYINKSFLKLCGLNKIEDMGNGVLKVGAGLKFSDLISYTNKNNYGGLEEIAGIPGTVGGLTAINAGAYGLEIFSKILEVEYLDKNYQLKSKTKDEIDYSYRNTEFKKNKNIITKVTFELSKGYDIVKVLQLLSKRKEKQPLEYPNIGSIFKNPKNDYAARLIEEVGLKGYKIGGAEISKKHSNFIVNKDNASFQDVMSIVKECKKQVYDKFKITLDEEIIIVK